ncbi:MAG: hypothetical protein RQ757_07205 [Pseudomonadales bacterium]|nr:hypothetical protein [Pseudomonadales bacterium]
MQQLLQQLGQLIDCPYRFLTTFYPGRIVGACLLSLASIELAAGQSSQELELQQALQLSTDTALQLARHEAALAQIRDDFGPYDPRMIEPLNDMADLLIANEDYERALQLLDQQQQLLKINYGLYNHQQIAIIEKQLTTHFKQQKWAAVDSDLSYLNWLYTRDSVLDVPARLEGLYKLRDWRLLTLNHDNRRREAEHLLSIRKLSQSALDMAEQFYDEQDPALLKYIYGAAQAELNIALAIILTSDISPDLITITEGIRANTLSTYQIRSISDVERVYGPRATSVINRSFKANMNRHANYLERIREFYQQNGNQEAEAMAVLLLGDARLMENQYEYQPMRLTSNNRGMSNIGFASNLYREAIALLEESGVSNEAIEQYFSCPVLLPASEFEPDFTASSARCQRNNNEEFLDLGMMHLMVDSVPGRVDADTTGFARESFSDLVISTVTFSVMANGQANRIEVINASPDSARNRSLAKSTLERLQFRPALENGRAVRSENIRLQLALPD